MNSEWKPLWIAALKSGKYTQGCSHLYNPVDNTFCCLGVLRDIVEPGITYGVFDKRTLEDEMQLGCELSEEATTKLHKIHAQGLSSDEMSKLGNMNDEGHTFEEIAEYIESYVSSDTPLFPDSQLPLV